MLFCIALLTAILFVNLFNKQLKKYSNIFYISAGLITIVVSCGFLDTPHKYFNTLMELFEKGALSTALWCIIMWAGAMKNGSKPIKLIMPLRGELSILAAILTLGHNIYYGKTYFKYLFFSPEKLALNQLAAAVITIIMLIIMIPLTIISFPKIRKKINAKKWKQYQKTAYIFYALMYLHIMLITVPLAKLGRESSRLNVFVYSLVFLSYAVLRIRKAILIKNKNINKRYAACVSISVFTVLFAAVNIYALPKNKKDTDILENTKDTAQDYYKENNSSVSGTYKAKAYGYDGDIYVTVTLEAGKIVSIQAESEESDSWYFNKIKNTVIDLILENQSTDLEIINGVDAVSGATYSTKGLISAIENALENLD